VPLADAHGNSAVPAGAASALVSATGATQTWDYDADGNLIQTVTPNGRTIDYAVDALNRTTSETVSSPQAGEISAVAYQHDGNGSVTQVKETIGGATRTATRTYDPFDRLNTATDVHGKALVYAYDAVGNRTSVTDTTDPANPQTITAWTYDALNHNVAVTADNAGTTITYFPSGRVHILTRPDGSTSTTEYDAAGRIASIVHASAGTEIAHERYDYDLDGNRWHQYESNGPLTNGEQTTTYTYDAADRLTDVLAPERTTHYTLDPTGNRTEEQIKDGTNTLIGDSTQTYNEREQLVSRNDAVSHLQVSLTWDADGNTATQTDATGTSTYSYDAHDRMLGLVQGSGGTPLTFDYQDDGLRIAKHQGAAETRYEYDQNSLLAETNAIGNVLVRYHYSDQQLLSRTETSGAPQTRHYLDDALNTPIATDNQGAIDSRTRYDAWGEVISQQGQGGAVTQASTDGTSAQLLTTDNQDIGFTGYLKDQETGLYYAKARYYDPRIARFTTQDPEEGNAMQPPSLHRYLYAYANPTVYTDPTGKYGIFFDGTWNDDRPETIATQHQTNVYRLRELYEGKRDYQIGVGTNWYTSKLCGATGCGAKRRVEKAYKDLKDFYNSDYAKKLRTNDPARWEKERQIDVFGFSRGSSEVREFANVLRERGIPDESQPYQVKVRDPETGRERAVARFKKFANVDVRFLGVFDTVPARGDPYHSIDMGWDLSVDPKFVRQGRQAMGVDEFRSAFDLYSFKTAPDAVLPSNLVEKWFRGAHSDIGGGYAPGDDGRSNALARVTLNWMYEQAKQAGVPLQDLSVEDMVLPAMNGMSEADVEKNLVHDSRTGITGFLDKLENRQKRTVYYTGGGKEELTREQMIKRMHDQDQSKAERVKESSQGQLILEPLENGP
jgi:RHS repeat-associated protein